MTATEAYRESLERPVALADAVRRNDLGALGRLLAEGAALETRDARGYAPLMLAAYSGSVEAFDYLLARGADPNSQDDAGNSVLMGAALKGSAALVRKLLDAGADPSLRNQEGIDARAIATAFGRHEIVALLSRHVAEREARRPR